MTNKTINLTEPLYEYLQSVSLREPTILTQLRKETAQLAEANMQIAPEQGQFMALLIQLMGATRALEIGVFTGYSALWTALALPEDGRLLALDVDEHWTDIGRRYWAAAGVDKKIDLRLAPAIETLDELLKTKEQYDFVFIDADKENYVEYYERVLRLVRPGGLIVVDNVLWSGRVATPVSEQDSDTRALCRFNQLLHDDQRISLSMLPVADGLTLVVKRHTR